MANEDFCLKWNDHHQVFFTLAEELVQQGALTDVTLATGASSFPAHRLVLSVCSDFFRGLFARPEYSGQAGGCVYLKDVPAHHLELLLSYMYRGEINVEEAELLSLIATARGLGIKGLSDVEGDEGGAQLPSPARKKKRKREVDEGKETMPVKAEEEQGEAQEPQVVEPKIEEVLMAGQGEGEDSWYENMGYRGEGEEGGEVEEDTGVQAEGGGESMDCPHCPKSFSSSWHLKRHVATHTKQKRFRCEYCGKLFSRNDNMMSHQKSVHAFLFGQGGKDGGSGEGLVGDMVALQQAVQ